MSVAVAKPLGRALRLEIETDPPAGQLVNMVANPDGELGGWGWLTPVAGSLMQGYPNPSGIRSLRYVPPSSTVAQNFTTEPLPVTSGNYVAASWNVPSAGYYYRARFEYLSAAGALLSSSPQSAYLGGTGVTGTGNLGPYLTPATTAYVRLRFDVYANTSGGNPAPGSYVYLNNVTVAQAATSAELGTNRTNLVTNPSFETGLTGWAAMSATAPLATDATQHFDGVQSARIISSATSVRTNLVTNPSVETGLTGITTTGSSIVISRVTGVSTAGGYSIRASGPGGTSFKTHEGAVLWTGDIGVAPSDHLHMRVSVRAGAGWPTNSYVQMGLRWFNSAGAELNPGSYPQLDRVTNPPADTWVTLDGITGVPASAHHCRPYVFLHKGGGGSSVIDDGDVVLIDAVLVERNSNGAYFDGSTGDTSTVTYAWTGTAHASTSTQTTKLVPGGTAGLISSTTLSAYGGQYHTVSAYAKRAVAGTAATVSLRLDWYSGATLLSSSSLAVGTLADNAWHRFTRTAAAPANATGVRVAVTVGFKSPTDVFYVDAVQLELGQVATAFLVGSVSTTDLSYIPPILYTNILGTTHDIVVNREGLNVGTLTAHILDSSLDPSQSGIVRPGRAVRLTARDAVDGNWRPVFTGMTSHATVAYDLRRLNAAKRAEIELTAVDNVQKLANQKRNRGVGTIAELPYVLEGCGVPWNVNGSGNQVASATLVSSSDESSALDQVSLTRDSQLGYAWVSRMGVLTAVDRAHAPDTAVGTVLDESVYLDVGLSYDSQQLINEVSVTYLSYEPDPTDPVTTPIAYGPYRDESSIDTWGIVVGAEFTVHGLPETDAAMQAYAQQVLDLNATPVVRLNTMQLHVEPSVDLLGIASWFAWVDLFDVVTIDCDRANVSNELAQVQSITHTISGPDSKWQIELGLNAPVAGSALARSGTVEWPAQLPTSSIGGAPVVVNGGGGGSGGGTAYTAGAGLSLVGADFRVNVDGVGIEIPADTLQLKDGGVTLPKLAPAAVSSLKLDVADEGATVQADAGKLNFTGSGISASSDGAGGANVDVPGSGLMTSRFRWDTSTTSAAAGKVGLNNSAPSSATRVHLSETNDAGANVSNVFARVGSGDQFYVQDEDDATVWARYTVTGPGVDQGTWWFFPVAYNGSSGAMPLSNARMLVSVYTGSNTPAGAAGGDLSGTYPNPTLSPTKDATLVHKTGAETITGSKTFDAPFVQTYQGSDPPTPSAGHATGPYFAADGLPYYLTPSGARVPFNVGDVQGALHLNPSFETVSGSAPTGWDYFWQVNSSIATETIDVLFGARSLTMTNSAGATGNNQLLLSSVFGVSPGDLLDVAAWARLVSGSSTLILGIMTAATTDPYPFDGVSTQQQTDAQALSSAWSKFSKRFTVPAGHTRCRMTLRVGCPTTAGAVSRIDATTSSVTGAAPNVLPGGSWPKEACRAVDTGTSLPGSTAPNVVDGISLAVGDRVLKAVPGGRADNGIYLVTTVGTGTNGVWQRAPDASTSAQLAAAQVSVASGNIYGGTRWATGLKATDALGSASLVWWQVGVPTVRGMCALAALAYSGTGYSRHTSGGSANASYTSGQIQVDTDGLTILVAGLYLVSLMLGFATGGTAVGARRLVAVGDTTQQYTHLQQGIQTTNNAGTAGLVATGPLLCAVGDRICAWRYSDTSGNFASTNGYLSAVRLCD